MAQSLLQRSVQTGIYSAPSGAATNQVTLLAMLASRYAQDPQIFEYVFNKVIQRPKLLAFLDERMGKATSTLPDYTVQEYNIERRQVKFGTTGAPFTVPAYSAGTNTVVIPLDVATMQLGGAYVMPQAGEFIAVPPDGTILEITAVTASGSTPSITVRHLSTTGTSFTLEGGQEVILLTGKQLADCDCPTGYSRFPGAPTNYDYTMFNYSDANEWCGDAIDAKQPWYAPFFLEDGTEVKMLVTKEQIDMADRFMDSNAYMTLLHPSWGLIPTLKSRGTIITHTTADEVLEEDLYYHATQLTAKGVNCMTYTVVCGIRKFYQYQALFNRTSRLNNGIIGIYDPSDSCKHLNMDWCHITIGGLNLWVTHDPSLSSGLGLGAANFKFPDAEFWIPECERPYEVKVNNVDWANAENPNAMLTKVFFKSQATGEVFDMLTDSDGILSARNSYGAGCRKNKWTIQSRWNNIIHAPEAWAVGGLF